MGRSELYAPQILIGPEDPERKQAIDNCLAPRLDYHLVANCCHGQLKQWHPPPAGLRGPRPVRMGRSFLGNLTEAVRLMGALCAGRVVYATGETWGLPVALVGAMMRKRHFRHVVYVHRVFSSTWLRFLGAMHKYLAVDGWICVTSHQAHLLRKTLGPASAPVVVVSQGVDTRFFDPAKAVPASRRPYILSVGVEMRNYDLLFDAVRGLDVDIVVKASSAWMAGGRSQLMSIPPNVRVITERMSYVELRDLYAGAALVVVPLHETPQAAGITTILEGMAMGKCILATQSSGLPDVLTDHRTGWVVPPVAADLRQAIAALWNEPDTRVALAAAGQQAVRAGFTLEHHANAVVEFLQTVAKER